MITSFRHIYHIYLHTSQHKHPFDKIHSEENLDNKSHRYVSLTPYS